MTGTLIVVGLRREARLVRSGHDVIVGLAGLEEALRRRPAGVVSFGLCGGLDPALQVGDLVIGSAVVTGEARFEADAAWAARLREATPGASLGLVASSAAMVPSPVAKAAVRARWGAAIADMESHAVAMAASQRNIPFAVVRAVSDSASDTLPRAAMAGFRPDGEADVGAVLRALLGRPVDLPALIRTAIHAHTALRALARAADVLRF